MKSQKYSVAVGAVALVTTLAMSVASGASVPSTPRAAAHTVTSHTATHTLICYKGKLIKRVTAVKPMCPAGWTTKKPVLAKTVAFSGSYTGTMSLLWSASDVKVTTLTGTGKGATLGLTAVSGTGSSSPTSSCDPINGTGTLSGGGSSLHLTLLTTSKACATDSAAPTSATVTGSAKVLGGTGKFRGATGTLKVTGSFSIKSTTAGSSESDGFSATLSGKLITK
jgi:hypothetical protein